MHLRLGFDAFVQRRPDTGYEDYAIRVAIIDNLMLGVIAKPVQVSWLRAVTVVCVTDPTPRIGCDVEAEFLVVRGVPPPVNMWEHALTRFEFEEPDAAQALTANAAVAHQAENQRLKLGEFVVGRIPDRLVFGGVIGPVAARLVFGLVLVADDDVVTERVRTTLAQAVRMLIPQVRLPVDRQKQRYKIDAGCDLQVIHAEGAARA